MESIYRSLLWKGLESAAFKSYPLCCLEEEEEEGNALWRQKAEENHPFVTFAQRIRKKAGGPLSNCLHAPWPNEVGKWQVPARDVLRWAASIASRSLSIYVSCKRRSAVQCTDNTLKTLRSCWALLATFGLLYKLLKDSSVSWMRESVLESRPFKKAVKRQKNKKVSFSDCEVSFLHCLFFLL